MTAAAPALTTGWQRFAAAFLRAFHAYGDWLVGISWRRFLLLALLLLIAAGVLSDLPLLHWSYDSNEPATATKSRRTVVVRPASPPADGAASGTRPGTVHIKRAGKDDIEISIDDSGLRIVGQPGCASAAASASSSAASSSSSCATADGAASQPRKTLVEINIPPGLLGEGVRKALEDARSEIEQAVREAAHETAGDIASGGAGQEVVIESDTPPRPHRVTVRPLNSLPQFAFFWIVASAILKVTYRRQIQAEAQAAQAVETAGAESLKRQVLEARLAAMQAQVEPHFLFNTLASIDHLIETDPPRASRMQKQLIALLRASLPSLRESAGGGSAPTARDLGRELAVIRPYLEILQMRMEERLQTTLDVPDGLLSAEFPPLMLQTLVENAIKHGLEPKAEGGTLAVKAEVVHGKLTLTVADSGLGFGNAGGAGAAGGGVGLANIRERLLLLYGADAALTLAANPGGGTRATISVPYRPLAAGTAA